MKRVWVYPRVCGGTADAMSSALPPSGLSPRVRGNRTTPYCATRSDRSIPACAGEPRFSCLPKGYPWVYPRVCGGTTQNPNVKNHSAGLSPRVRGNPQRGQVGPRHSGSIPACAGEPVRPTPATPAYRVYPRVCGGTETPSAPSLRRMGLSPRVRGNHRAEVIG